MLIVGDVEIRIILTTMWAAPLLGGLASDMLAEAANGKPVSHVGASLEPIPGELRWFSTALYSASKGLKKRHLGTSPWV